MWVHGCKYVLETQPWDISEEIRDAFYCCEIACNHLVYGSCRLNNKVLFWFRIPQTKGIY